MVNKGLVKDMATFKVHKVTALPGTLQPDAMYIVAPAANPGLLEIYVTDSSATSPVRSVISVDVVKDLIDTALADANTLTIVADIAERDALLPLDRAKWVYVIDATADATVDSGGATYLYNPDASEWIKTSESESLDLVINWTDIVGRPTAAPADIDNAVALRHTHANKTELDQLGENAQQELTYRGAQVKTEWSTVGW